MRAEGSAISIEIEPAFAVDRNDMRDGAAELFEMLNESQHGWMFDGRDDDGVALALRVERGEDGRIVRFRAAGGENDFVAVSRANERLNLLARRSNRFASGLSERVRGGRVAEMIGVEG